MKLNGRLLPSPRRRQSSGYSKSFSRSLISNAPNGSINGDLGLPIINRWTDERPATWLALGNESFLSLWPPETGGAAGIHGCRGGAHVHLALRVPIGTLATMETRLRDRGHDVESGWEFGPGNLALYLDDPDGNVIEITERLTLWDGSTIGSRPS